MVWKNGHFVISVTQTVWFYIFDALYQHKTHEAKELQKRKSYLS